MRVILAIVIVAVAAFLIAGTCLPIKKDARPKVCLHCGIQRQDRIVLGILRSTLSSTEFSTWYQRRIGHTHTHRWQEDSTTTVSGENLWGTRWELSHTEGPSPGIQLDYSMLATVMRRLERDDLDRALWKELASPDSIRSRQAVDASWNFFDRMDQRLFLPDENEVHEQRVHDWWKYTQLYLQKPEAARSGFQEFVQSSGGDRMSWLRVYGSSGP